LSNQDGTRDAAKDMMMTKEEKEWLNEAMQSYTFDEVKEMQRLIEEMVAKDKTSPDYKEFMLDHLDAVHDYTFSLDNNKNLCHIGGFDYLFDTVFMTDDEDILEKCCFMIASCSQNNVWMQNFALRLEPLRLMNVVLKVKNMSAKVGAFSALSALIRGLNIDIKRHFIDVDGVEYCLTLLKDEKNSFKLKAKIMS